MSQSDILCKLAPFAVLVLVGAIAAAIFLVVKARQRRLRDSCLARLSIAFDRKTVVLSLQELVADLTKAPCKKRYIMLVGPQGSGKSVIAELLASRGFFYLSMDKMVDEEPSLALMLQHLNQRFFAQFDEALKRGDNIVDDNLNVTRDERSDAIKRVRAAGYRDIMIVHLEVPLSVCQQRNAARLRPVPEWIVERCWNSLAGIDRPSPIEGPLVRVQPEDNDLRRCTMYLVA
ncbi:MAG: ATP-binding protein [Candidatus Obscuribacterales bacterium]|nr:ATP-binding protein [Candidatus Obscuribacterales bacterium]